MVQIDVDIFEPQGIRKLDAQASFLSKELAAQTIKKSFSGKKVCEEQGVGAGEGEGERGNFQRELPSNQPTSSNLASLFSVLPQTNSLFSFLKNFIMFYGGRVLSCFLDCP